MPRLNTQSEVYNDVSRYGFIMDAIGGGTSTTTAAYAAGVTVIAVASATNYAAGDPIRMLSSGGFEENIIESIASLNLTLRMPTAFAHPTGAAVVERVKVTLGELAPGSFQVTPNTTANQIKSDTFRGVYCTLYTDAMFTVNAATINHSLENLAFVHGVADSAITGAGTTSSPRRILLTTQNLMALQNISIFGEGHIKSGVTQEVQVWNVDITPTGNRTYATGTGVPVPLTAIGRANAILEYP